MVTAPIPLGPFVLSAPLAAGGMGEVWRATHAPSGQRVAVKVIHGEHARSARFVEAFQAEVHAMARLDHRAVVVVHDVGRIPPEAASASAGRLTAGSPWVAMEYASGGSLLDVGRPGSWSELSALTVLLLDALAHVHARGVVHRDLKPANVLVCTDADPRPGPRITDFGIAWLADRAAGGEALGTPHYMAPEQARGHGLELGPWSDLYALACVVWALACGRPPHGEQSPATAIQARKRGTLPPFEPDIAVPPGLDAWLRWLLEPTTHHRPQRAAEAVAGLRALGPATRQPRRRPVGSASPAQTLFPDDITGALASWAFTPAPAPTRHVTSAPERGPPPIPARWEHPGAPVPDTRLEGVGLGLLGLRLVPMTGRAAAQSTLWDRLRQVCDGESRAVVIRGPAGIGRTRLLTWLRERVHALAVAHHVTLTPRADTLEQVLATLLRVHGLTGARLADRLEAWLPDGSPDERALIQQVLEAKTASPRSRQRVLLRCATARCPLVLGIDHEEAAGPELALSLLRMTSSLPTLVVVTAPLAPEDPFAERALEQLAAHPRCDILTLGPLGPAGRTRLIRDVLHLAPGLAARIDARTGGHPGFVVGLVTDLVERGTLVSGPRGFELAPGASLALPRALDEVQRARLTAILHGLTPDAAVALEIAATLGLTLSRATWEEAVGDAETCARALEPLVRLGSMTTAGGAQGTVTFLDAAVREGLLERARRAGRLPDHHLCCAMALGDDGPALALGRHWMAAGRPRRAAPPLVASNLRAGRPPPAGPGRRGRRGAPRRRGARVGHQLGQAPARARRPRPRPSGCLGRGVPVPRAHRRGAAAGWRLAGLPATSGPRAGHCPVSIGTRRGARPARRCRAR